MGGLESKNKKWDNVMKSFKYKTEASLDILDSTGRGLGNPPIGMNENVNKPVVFIDQNNRFNDHGSQSHLSHSSSDEFEDFTDALNSPLSSELSLKLCYNPTQVTQDGDYTKQVMNDSPTMANINKNAFTITRHRKIEVPSIDNTELQIKQSPALESNVLKKVATLTLDNALADSRSFGDVKPKPPPDKLQFHTCAKFEGQMLINWFLSSFPEENHLLKVVALQFCSHLLSAGVIQQISDKYLEASNQFKVDRMYFWSKSETPVPTVQYSTVKKTLPSWPSTFETEHNNNNNVLPLCTHVQLENQVASLKLEIEKLRIQADRESATRLTVGQAATDLTRPNQLDRTSSSLTRIPSPKFKTSPKPNQGKNRSSSRKNLISSSVQKSKSSDSIASQSRHTRDQSCQTSEDSSQHSCIIPPLSKVPISNHENSKSPPSSNIFSLPNVQAAPPPPPPPPLPPPPPMMGTTPPPMMGTPPPPPPMMGTPPPPPPMMGTTPPPPPMMGATPPPPPMMGTTPPPPPMMETTPPPPPMMGTPPPPPPMMGTTPPPPPMMGTTPPPPPMMGTTPPPPPMIGGTFSSPAPMMGNVPTSVSNSSNVSSPTPLPTPPVGGWNVSRANFRKDPVNPPKPMKPLYWTRLIVSPEIPSDTTPLWKELEEVPINNLEEFTELFSRQVTAQRPVTRKRQQKSSKVQNVARLIDSKRSQNVGILAQSLHIEFSEIESAIFNMDASVVSLEALQQIYDVRATDEEINLIRAHLASNSDLQLDKPEQFLADLADIPHFSERIACFMFEADFSDSIALIDSKLNNIKSVCEFLMKSEHLKKVIAIILSLGNFMNGGNRLRGQADGFGLEILPKLKDVRSKDNSVTLLHFIVRTYLRNSENPLNESLPVPEPGDVDRAASVVFDDIHSQLSTLAKKLDAVTISMNKVVQESKPDHMEPFRTKMESCVKTANNSLTEQLENLEDCSKRFKSVLKFYQYIPKGIPESDVTPKDLFMLWAPFCHDFKDFWKKEQDRIIKTKVKEVKRKQEERKQQVQKIKKQETGLKARFQRLERLQDLDST